MSTSLSETQLLLKSLWQEYRAIKQELQTTKEIMRQAQLWQWAIACLGEYQAVLQQYQEARAARRTKEPDE